MSKRERWRLPTPQDVHVDVDKYINRFIPPNQLYRLPEPIARFLGYRENPAPEVGNILVAFWAMLGAFCGIVVVGTVFHYSDLILKYHPPVIFASLGATAILDYNTIQSPLAQPRAAILGHTLAATAGVAVAKLFMLRSDFDDIRWIAGAMCCAVSSALMTLTNTVHPPGGATALLAAVDPTTSELGWMFIPLILLGSTLMLGVALLVNNIQRQYPLWWWTPKDVGRKKSDEDDEEDMENADEDKEDVADLERAISKERRHFQHTITIAPERIIFPDHFRLGQVEVDILNAVRDRLRDMARHDLSRKNTSSSSRSGSRMSRG